MHSTELFDKGIFFASAKRIIFFYSNLYFQFAFYLKNPNILATKYLNGELANIIAGVLSKFIQPSVGVLPHPILIRCFIYSYRKRIE